MHPDTKPIKWILNPKLRIFWHLLFWIIMYLDEFLSIFGITEAYDTNFTNIIILSFFLDVALVYLNFYILIPHFLLKNKFWRYIGITLISILFVNYVNISTGIPFEEWCENCTWQARFSDFILGTFIPTLTLLGTAIGVKLFKLLLQNQGRLREMETDKLQTELAYLKDQVNPHFLFNALNNIYVQSRKRPAEASESILLLSDLLRYQLYDCAKEKVYLSNEIDYLKNYLKLDKMRKSKAEIDFQIKGHPNGKMVAPFLFLPFIENAVKHGLSIDNESFMRITFDISDNNIHFVIENSKPQNPTQYLAGGIGLNNVKRRLKLLYPKKHDLKITDENNVYKVDLMLVTGD